jgi:diguanylate cyclase (GGDEF)-like protein/PAS domain S-box-containing protein
MKTSLNPDVGARDRSTLLRDHSPALEFLKDESGRLVYCNKTFESVFSAAALMESSHDAVVATTVDGLVVSWNAGAAEMYGYPAAEMLGRSISILEAAEPGGEPRDIRERIQAGESVVRFDAVRLHRDGSTVDVAVSVSPIRDASGDLVGFASIARDMSECKRSEELIIYQTFHDPLTGLANRALLMERLSICLGKARRGNKLLALLYLDLDRFKSVNDGVGHAAGDAVFQEAARRLMACVRDTDTVARVGGDEFVVLLPEIARAEDAGIVASKLLASVAEPFFAGGRRIDLSTSIGVSVYPDDGDDAEILLRSADNAMYRAKERGRNNYQLSTPELSEEAIKRLDLQVGLRQALERQELFLHYQPVLSLTTGRIIELEALVRWQHPEKGLIMPAAFIDVAEKAGMMVPLGQWVLGKAVSQLRIWQARGYTDLRVAINLSPSQFHERNLASTVQQALADSALKPETLEIEITEGVAMEDAEVTVANLMALRNLNVGISIDDFGTGYSSLSYLKKFPVTTLKIDQSFVSDVTTNAADAGIVHAVVAMAHGLNLNVIAEGVETKEQFAYLKDSGCDALQGYWFCRPQPAEAIDVLLAEEKERWSPRA